VKTFIHIAFTISLVFFGRNCFASDTLLIKGQASAYAHFNPENKLSFWSGGRYIPQLNYKYKFPSKQLLDFETSANLYGNLGWKPSDSSNYSGDIKPYRLWARYSSSQWECRIGLQKINFGSASLLRPLMWFDQLDPKDPLQLTDGVWGGLFRYYFLNNTNLWAWVLYGNKNIKGFETYSTVKAIPEFGGRIQFPVPKGEMAFSYHQRKANFKSNPLIPVSTKESLEYRAGFDAKFDMLVGWWFEASWTNFQENIGIFSNQELINLGTDYTFGVGNGLTITYEQFIASSDKNAFAFDNTITFSLFQASYPLGFFDNLSALVYFDWKNKNPYTFLNWQRQFNVTTLHCMVYYNPKQYTLPTIGSSEILYAGYGMQVMFVFNH
jgi:hypothetical protein